MDSLGVAAAPGGLLFGAAEGDDDEAGAMADEGR